MAVEEATPVPTEEAMEEGAAPEAFNLASLYKLPVLFLCENNGKYGTGRAVAAAQSSSMAAYPLTDHEGSCSRVSDHR